MVVSSCYSKHCKNCECYPQSLSVSVSVLLILLNECLKSLGLLLAMFFSTDIGDHLMVPGSYYHGTSYWDGSTSGQVSKRFLGRRQWEDKARENLFTNNSCQKGKHEDTGIKNLLVQVSFSNIQICREQGLKFQSCLTIILSQLKSRLVSSSKPVHFFLVCVGNIRFF